MHEQQSPCQYHLPDLAISQETNHEVSLWTDGLGDSSLRGK